MKPVEDPQRVIAQLKDALIIRENRINELELAIVRASGTTKTNLKSSGAVALEGFGSKSVHPLLLIESSGVYPDLWTNLMALLYLHGSVQGKALTLVFYLPETETGTEKTLSISSTFAETSSLTVRRGVPTQYVAEVPSATNVSPSIKVEVDIQEVHLESDVRTLGVRIVNIDVHDPKVVSGSASVSQQ